MQLKSITECLDTDYREYGLYSLYLRGIPNFFDGLKPVQRKIYHSVLEIAKDKPKKVLEIIGRLYANGYHHGDASGGPACAKMAQDYVCSGNNIPILKGIGNFGNRLINTPAAPRYINVTVSNISNYIFLDNEVLEKDDDFLNKEPKTYAPIIPMVLINQQQGMGVGFSTNIPPHNPLNIIDYMQEVIAYLNSDKEEFKYKTKIKPHWKNSDLEVTMLDDVSFEICGSYEEISNKKIRIVELPPKYDKRTYTAVLNKLHEQGVITGYFDRSVKNDFNIEVKLKKEMNEQQIINKFKLVQRMSYNLTVIYNRKVVVYDSVYELINDFIYERYKVYVRRYEKLIADLYARINFLTAKIDFIINIMQKIKEVGMAITKDDINEYADKYDFKDELVRMPIYKFTNDEVEDCLKEISESQKLIVKYANINIYEVYAEELNILKAKLQKEK
jgi:DNA gyrase/topoisomerase IV subunit A